VLTIIARSDEIVMHLEAVSGARVGRIDRSDVLQDVQFIGFVRTSIENALSCGDSEDLDSDIFARIRDTVWNQ
jgi:hypothetical protein